MAIKGFFKKYFQTTTDKERDRLLNLDLDISERFEQIALYGESRATEILQLKQEKVRKRLEKG